ncbi:MAG: glycosyltransferase family 2 protein [Brotaphodocola sp.]
MKVSVIIPVYNVEKYLKRCLESVLKQTFQCLEIILVDDGSGDGSGIMCDEAADYDERCIVIHKKNAGLSSARNVGLESATGEYVIFIDSDDYLSCNFIENGLNLCEKYDADVAILQMLYVAEETNEEIKKKQKYEVMILNPEQAIKESLYQRYFSCCTPGKIYKRKLFHNVRFPEGRLSEDLATCHLIFDAASRIVYCNEIGYYYRQHNMSIMHCFNPGRMDALEWSSEIEKFCFEKYPDIVQAAICRTFNVAVHLLLDLPDFGEVRDMYVGDIWHAIRRTRNTAIFCSETRFREKAAAFISFMGEKNLKRIWNSRVAVRK